MSLSTPLLKRCQNKCELCGADDPSQAYEVSAAPIAMEPDIALCDDCADQIASEQFDLNHWRCLNDSMWSAVPAVQAMSWRLLKKLDSETWAQAALDMLYLEDEVRLWAEAGAALEAAAVVHKDINGQILAAGDNVVITKDLDVKGTSFTAKRGTTVRGISLTQNPEHIEGRVNGTRIVILTRYVKKS